MYWSFYRSTIILSLGVSLAVAILALLMLSGNVFVIFAGCFVTVGPLSSFLYKEITCPLEYYFYYNRGISKIKLLLFCLLVNIPLSSLVLIFSFYVA